VVVVKEAHTGMARVLTARIKASVEVESGVLFVASELEVVD